MVITNDEQALIAQWDFLVECETTEGLLTAVTRFLNKDQVQELFDEIAPLDEIGFIDE